MERGITRRGLLSTTVLAGAGAIAAASAARSARALSLQPMDAQSRSLYLAACSSRDGAYHRELVAEARKELAGRASDAQIEAAIVRMTCPICGCPITTF
ncbi:MAG TPA: hypothetical protein VFA50_14470 [Stellaceae bacterium]|nr:hypothetical protein [Stellaceae bacterium]